MEMKNVFYTSAVIILALVFSVILGLPTLLNLEWVTSISNSIKSFLILHIELTLFIIGLAFIILLYFSSTGNVCDFFDTSKYSESLSKKLDNAKHEHSTNCNAISSKLSHVYDEIHSEKRNMESALEKTVYKVKLLENDLSYHYKDTFRYTRLISASILKVASHTKLKDCEEFEKISKEYQQSVQSLSQYR